MMRQDRADLDHEHHRVLPLDVGPEHDERLLQRRLHKFGCEQAVPPALRGALSFSSLRRRASALATCGWDSQADSVSIVDSY